MGINNYNSVPGHIRFNISYWFSDLNSIHYKELSQFVGHFCFINFDALA
jgi:hypothetical protein